MKLNYYRSIIEKYREINKRDCVDDLCYIFPDVSRSTLESIVYQEYQRKTKKVYHYHSAPHKVKSYYKRFVEGLKKYGNRHGLLIKIADEVDLSPSLMAKFILEHHYKETGDEKVKGLRLKVNEMLKNTSLIEDPNLATEVKMCVLVDENYGPVSDAIRTSVGQAYEDRLKIELTELGFTFVDENQLRQRGYDKTPDIKLDIPLALDGQVINWIESKASFGDEERHKEYLRDQYWSYCNRFGPGLVIYWAGYIDELNAYKEQGIVISDKFPSNVTKMDPTFLVKRRYSN